MPTPSPQPGHEEGPLADPHAGEGPHRQGEGLLVEPLQHRRLRQRPAHADDRPDRAQPRRGESPQEEGEVLPPAPGRGSGASKGGGGGARGLEAWWSMERRSFPKKGPCCSWDDWVIRSFGAVQKKNSMPKMWCPQVHHSAGLVPTCVPQTATKGSTLNGHTDCIGVNAFDRNMHMGNIEVVEGHCGWGSHRPAGCGLRGPSAR